MPWSRPRWMSIAPRSTTPEKQLGSCGPSRHGLLGCAALVLNCDSLSTKAGELRLRIRPDRLHRAVDHAVTAVADSGKLVRQARVHRRVVAAVRGEPDAHRR